MVSLGKVMVLSISSCVDPTEAKASCARGDITENADINILLSGWLFDTTCKQDNAPISTLINPSLLVL